MEIMNNRQENRRSPRAPVSIRIDYSTVDQFFWDFARNINEEGLFVEANEPLDVGTTVTLKFYLPNLESPIETTGEVLWVTASPGANGDPLLLIGDERFSSKPGMGIQFKSLDRTSREAINRLVKELRKK
jgi:uncharacterized protein (TIGR02266 family)